MYFGTDGNASGPWSTSNLTKMCNEMVELNFYSHQFVYRSQTCDPKISTAQPWRVSFDMHDCFFPLPPHINVFLNYFFHFFCLLEHPDWETILGAMLSHLGSRCSDSSHSERYAMPLSPLSQKIQWICQLRSSTTCSLGVSLSFATPYSGWNTDDVSAPQLCSQQPNSAGWKPSEDHW